MKNISADDVASVVFSYYSDLNFKPPTRQYTILAGFVLFDTTTGGLKVISLATGSKCLPAARLPKSGEAVHDSHAEILARRGAVRWFLEEVGRGHSGLSTWLQATGNNNFTLKDGVDILLYVSTVPCGDASTRYLAAFQDPEMAALKDSTKFPALAPSTASRGRDNYSLYGVLRTKPGRADSPPTSSMSCSDKIASWSVFGFQGALASHFLQPLYINTIIIGEVEQEMRDLVQADCERAFWGRLNDVNGRLPAKFKLCRPSIYFTSLPFEHSRISLMQAGAMSSCNDSLCWVADSPTSREVLINGLKRGVSPKHSHKAKFWPKLSRVSLCNLYGQTAERVQLPSNHKLTYWEIKQSASEYQAAKTVLQGPEGPFAGWVKSGAPQKFDACGNCQDSKIQES